MKKWSMQFYVCKMQEKTNKLDNNNDCVDVAQAIMSLGCIINAAFCKCHVQCGNRLSIIELWTVVFIFYSRCFD